jgi:hypothetical protein
VTHFELAVVHTGAIGGLQPTFRCPVLQVLWTSRVRHGRLVSSTVETDLAPHLLRARILVVEDARFLAPPQQKGTT